MFPQYFCLLTDLYIISFHIPYKNKIPKYININIGLSILMYLVMTQAFYDYLLFNVIWHDFKILNSQKKPLNYDTGTLPNVFPNCPGSQVPTRYPGWYEGQGPSRNPISWLNRPPLVQRYPRNTLKLAMRKEVIYASSYPTTSLEISTVTH